MKKRFIPFLFCILMLYVSGCSLQDEVLQKKDAHETQEVSSVTPAPLQEFDWRTESWKTFEEATTGEQLSVIEYVPFAWEEPDFEYLSDGKDYACFGGDLYMFRRFYLESEARYFLYIMDGETREVTMWELDKEISGLTANLISDMQVLGEDELVFFAIDLQNIDEELYECHGVHVNVEGEFLYQTDLTDFYHEYAPIQGSPYGGIMAPVAPIFDIAGNSYYRDADNSQVYRIDKEGNIKLFLDYSNDKKVSITGEVFLTDGSVAFRVSDNNEWEGQLLWANPETDTPKNLVTLSRAYLDKAFISEHGMVYYVSNYKLFAWDIRTGTCERIFSFQDNNISSLQYILMDVNSKGEILLYQYAGDERCVYVLSPEPVDVSETKKLTVACISNENSYLQSCAASYSRKNPGVVVQYEVPAEEKEAERTRILADIISGGGPDMLWVSAEDMYLLQEKGAICDLSELISEEIQKEIFDGIIASGTVNGEFVGLVPGAYPVTMITAKETWEGTSWNVLDILELLENNKQLETGIWQEYSGNMPANYMLYNLVCFDMKESPFIDFENGESKFEREEFVRLLELTKELGATSIEGNAQSTKSGQTLALYSNVASISAFCRHMRMMGDECHLVGMPSQSGYIGNWLCYNFLVINKNSLYKEEIKGYLEELLSLQNQRQMLMNSVRRDVIEESMIVPEWSNTPQYKTAAGTYILLEAKPDGTPYFEEYLDFLENCGPHPFRVKTIEDIIWEEVDFFYNDVYSAEKTAENIDSRVQLYLDEQK